MSHIALKKQEEKNEQKLKELLRRPENKKCFDCPVKSPFFVNVSIQTFVCARCSGLVREVGHRVKSISASKFSGPELLSLELGGNEVAKSIWLSTYHSNSSEPETDSDVRYFMRQKYYEQKWLDRKKAIDHAERVKLAIKQTYSEDGSPIKKTSLSQNERKQSVELSRPKMYSSQSSWIDDNTPIGLISTVKSQTNNNNNKNQDLLLDDDIIPSPKSPTPGFGIPLQSNNNNSASVLPPIQFESPKNTPVKKPTPANDIYADLVGLDPTPAVRKASYTGGVLQPNSPTRTTATVSNNYMTSPILQQQPLKVNTASSIPTPKSSTNNTPSNNKWSDPYAALRGLSLNDSPSTYSSTNNNNLTRQTNGNNININTTYQGFQTSASPTSASSFTKSSLFSDLDPLSQLKR